MAASAKRNQSSGCEYQRLFVTPQQSGSEPAAWTDDSPEFPDGLMAAVEKLDAATQEGWSLVSVSVEKDARGRRWLSALMKKPLAASDQQPAVKVHAAAPPLSIFRAA